MEAEIIDAVIKRQGTLVDVSQQGVLWRQACIRDYRDFTAALSSAFDTNNDDNDDTSNSKAGLSWRRAWKLLRSSAYCPHPADHSSTTRYFSRPVSAQLPTPDDRTLDREFDEMEVLEGSDDACRSPAFIFRVLNSTHLTSAVRMLTHDVMLTPTSTGGAPLIYMQESASAAAAAAAGGGGGAAAAAGAAAGANKRRRVGAASAYRKRLPDFSSLLSSPHDEERERERERDDDDDEDDDDEERQKEKDPIILYKGKRYRARLQWQLTPADEAGAPTYVRPYPRGHVEGEPVDLSPFLGKLANDVDDR